MNHESDDELLRLFAANAIRSGEIPLPKKASSIQKIRSLQKQYVTLDVKTIPVQGGKLEATLELAELEKQKPPVAFISFGGCRLISMPLREDGYTQQYQTIHKSLKNGDYSLQIKPNGEIGISFE